MPFLIVIGLIVTWVSAVVVACVGALILNFFDSETA